MRSPPLVLRVERKRKPVAEERSDEPGALKLASAQSARGLPRGEEPDESRERTTPSSRGSKLRNA